MGPVPILKQAMIDATQIQRLATTHDVCGEGCVWHPQSDSVFWTDINRGLLHRYSSTNPQTSGRVETWNFGEPVTAVVLTNYEQLIVLVLGSRIVVWDIRTHKIVEELYRLPEWPDVRCNDARVDPAGVLWFGAMQNNVLRDGTTGRVTERRGALFSLAAGFQAKRWYGGFGISNTVAWSPDGTTMYFGDTLENTLYCGSFDPLSSSLKGCEAFFTGFGRGLPDGSAVDAEGYLWNCRFGGSCVVRVAPDGSIAGVVETPVKNPTTCAFGGDGLSTLFFTAAESTDTQPEALAGSLFSLRVPVRGLPVTPFRL